MGVRKKLKKDVKNFKEEVRCQDFVTLFHVVRQCRDMCIGALEGERRCGGGLWAQQRIHRVWRMEVHWADAGLQAWRPFPAGSGEEAEEYGILAVWLHFLLGSSDRDRVGVYVLRK